MTGAGNGLGRQICLQLKHSGAKIICWDIDSRGNTGITTELKSVGVAAYNYDVDVSDMNQVQATAEKVSKHYCFL